MKLYESNKGHNRPNVCARERKRWNMKKKNKTPTAPSSFGKLNMDARGENGTLMNLLHFPHSDKTALKYLIVGYSPTRWWLPYRAKFIALFVVVSLVVRFMPLFFYFQREICQRHYILITGWKCVMRTL